MLPEHEPASSNSSSSLLHTNILHHSWSEITLLARLMCGPLGMTSSPVSLLHGCRRLAHEGCSGSGAIYRA